ncbi:MAG TPA: Nramp family divalent metal transporter, partial [Thermoleophilaceae bacterium]|nr:Nramp family divalent metal transporter [Thermoleophilaceae bacterium]
ALNLLFGVPLFVAGLMTGVVAFAILALQTRGYRRFELAIAGLFGVVLLGFLYQAFEAGPDAGKALHGVIPRLDGNDSLLLAAGILGATVMPHVIYLHSALTQSRIRVTGDEERKRLMSFQRLDVGIAMTVAGVVNVAMLLVAAALFHTSGHTGVDTIDGAYHGFQNLVGNGTAIAFGLALLASGFASSSVGTFAGQVVMQGFIARRIPLLLRRLVTMAPALVVLGTGLDPTRSLVFSQVVLSFGIPFALIPLVIFTSRKSLMGKLVNGRVTTVAASVIAALVVGLNVFLLARAAGI